LFRNFIKAFVFSLSIAWHQLVTNLKSQIVETGFHHKITFAIVVYKSYFFAFLFLNFVENKIFKKFRPVVPKVSECVLFADYSAKCHTNCVLANIEINHSCRLVIANPQPQPSTPKSPKGDLVRDRPNDTIAASKSPLGDLGVRVKGES